MTTLNLSSIIIDGARRRPDSPAISLGPVSLTYAQLEGMSRKVASALDDLLGTTEGNGDDGTPPVNVAIMLPNVPQFSVAYFGILYRGSAVVPLNVLLKRDEVAYHLNDCEAKALIVWEGFLEEGRAGFEMAGGCDRLIVVPQSPKDVKDYEGASNFNALLGSSPPRADVAVTSPTDTAVILYTSGTTGTAKGAELSHFNLFQNCQSVCNRLTPFKPDDKILSSLPLFHSFAQTVLHNAGLAAGAEVVLQPRFDPEGALKIMQERGITVFAGVPTMYFALLHHPKASEYDVSTLKYSFSGGSAMPVEVMSAFDERYGVNILEGYGLSETSPVASFNFLDRPKKAGSIGLPLHFTEMRLVDDKGEVVKGVGSPGEIQVRGHNVMKGYYRKPKETAEAITSDGWFKTGDVGTRDEDGYYFIVDRKKDMLIRGGFNVYPREVEEVLYKHEAVAEAAVVGIHDEKYGEEVRAVVALKPGAAATAEEIREFCKERLASYKYPRIVDIMDSLPKGPTGKILKRKIRETGQPPEQPSSASQ